MPSERTGKIRVGGVKLSRELVQVDVTGQQGDGFPAASLLAAMAREKINMTYLTASFVGRSAAAAFCVAAADFDQVRSLIDSDPDLAQRVRSRAPVSALTVFPHRSDLRLLGILFGALCEAECPVYGMASSISTLTLTTGYWSIGRALQALESVLDLPVNHSPYRQEFLVRQV